MRCCALFLLFYVPFSTFCALFLLFYVPFSTFCAKSHDSDRGLEITLAEMNTIFGEIDLDDNGNISFEEFSEWFLHKGIANDEFVIKSDEFCIENDESVLKMRNFAFKMMTGGLGKMMNFIVEMFDFALKCSGCCSKDVRFVLYWKCWILQGICYGSGSRAGINSFHQRAQMTCKA